MKYYHIHPTFPPSKPLCILHSTSPPSSMSSSLFSNTLRLISAASICMAVGPSTGPWETYQEPRP